MDQLVIIQNRQAVTTSLQVAESFEKRHDNVMRDIESFKKDVLNFEEMFFETNTPDSYGRGRKTYLMNRDGFTLLAMGFTGNKALDFKLKYIQAFNQMAEILLPQPLSEKEQLKASMRLSLETSEEVEALKSEVSEVKDTVQVLFDTMRIDGRQEYALNSQGKAKVMEVLGGYDSQAYSTVGKKVFAQLWRDFKNHFRLPRYSELPKSKFDEGVYFISKWRPSTTMEIEIETCNKQSRLKLAQ